MNQRSSLVSTAVFLTMLALCRGFSVGSRKVGVPNRIGERLGRRLLSSSTLRMVVSPTNSDRSAASQSRPPFRMPRNSPDDSKPPTAKSTPGEAQVVDQKLTWNPLGLYTELVGCLQGELGLPAPTPVQTLVIPELLKEEKESLAFLAATGSGKTLAYLLPLMQQLKQQEQFEDYERRPRRPRLLILAPTRELALQITQVMKSLSHSIKLSSQALVGGQDRGNQRRSLANRPVDVIVATPGRLLQHWKDGNVFLGGLDSIVLDEMDTMLEQGFQKELREILYPLLYTETPTIPENNGGKRIKLPAMKEGAPRVILTSATMTQTIQKLLGDNPKSSKLVMNAKKLHGGNDPTTSSTSNKLLLPPMQIISAPGLHKAVPRLEQVFVDVGNTDKVSLLVDVISSQKTAATIVFCNTAASVRAVQYALAEARVKSLAYHGELNSVARGENLANFRLGAADESSTEYDPDDDTEHHPKVLIATDLAARGIDIPQVDHVVMFDFPLNAMDYLHRSGRTARGAGRGKVTALVAKRDKVLATAIQQAVMKGEPLDGLSSRKSDYLPGARFGAQPKQKKSFGSGKRGGDVGRGAGQKKSTARRSTNNKSFRK
jgi:superfamily II DNA/RNA helicase